MLFAGTIRPMTCPADRRKHKDVPRRPDARQKDKKRVETKSYSNTEPKTSSPTNYEQLVGEGRHNRQKEDRDIRRTNGGLKRQNVNKIGEKKRKIAKGHTILIVKVTPPTKNGRVPGGGVPSTRQGIGHHNEQK